MRFEVYRDTAGAWRWRMVAANNRIIADSAESYTRKTDAVRAWHSVVKAIKS